MRLVIKAHNHLVANWYGGEVTSIPVNVYTPNKYPLGTFHNLWSMPRHLSKIQQILEPIWLQVSHVRGMDQSAMVTKC